MNYTTIEQSKKLLELGLNPDTADMCYIQTPADKYRITAYNLEYCNNLKQQRGSDMNLIPCWSLAALIDLIPEGIHWYLDENGLTIAEVDYYKDGKEVYVFRDIYRNPVNAMVWLLENNYIKSNKNE